MLATIETTADLRQRRQQYLPNAIATFNPSTARSAKGAIVTDLDGRELIDFAGGIGVLNAGHSPEPVVRAIQAQAEKLIHTCFNVAAYEEYLDLAEKLANLLPHGNAGTKVMLTNSGAEAVENAVKIARQATGKPGILCFTGAFHGRTMMAMTLTAKPGNKLGCAPFAPEVYRLGFPNFFRYGAGMTEDAYLDQEIQRLRDFFLTQADASNMAAVIVELVQGEGGFNVCPPKYLQALRAICDEKGMLLIVDEVQTGFGRTGKWAAYEHYGIVPDLSTWAKSLGSGMPIAAILGKSEIMDAAKTGTLGGTYAGNPVCCAAALATLNYMEEVDICARGRHVGEVVRRRFESMQKRFPTVIGDVRGLGAMLAFELVKNGKANQPDADLAKALINKCAENGLIIISAGTFGNVVRVLSPLIIEDGLLERGLDILENSLDKILNRFLQFC